MDIETEAPTASLPGVVTGQVRNVDVSADVGESVVVLVFYPSNDGPAAGHSAAVLRSVENVADELDKPVSTYGVATESVHSHRRFADEADVSMPLLSDLSASFAEAYDVTKTLPSGQTAATMSVFALGYGGMCIFEWVAPEPETEPPLKDLRSTIAATTPGQSAAGTYRVGFTQYQEGRRLLSSGLSHCEDEEWTIARRDFADACDQFANATDTFIKTQGLARDSLRENAEVGRRRTTKLWEATEWLAGYASAADDGNTEAKNDHHEKAQRLLRELREYDPVPEPTATSVAVAEHDDG